MMAISCRRGPAVTELGKHLWRDCQDFAKGELSEGEFRREVQHRLRI